MVVPAEEIRGLKLLDDDQFMAFSSAPSCSKVTHLAISAFDFYMFVLSYCLFGLGLYSFLSSTVSKYSTYHVCRVSFASAVMALAPCSHYFFLGDSDQIVGVTRVVRDHWSHVHMFVSAVTSIGPTFLLWFERRVLALSLPMCVCVCMLYVKRGLGACLLKLLATIDDDDDDDDGVILR